jgi:hypothetical protein
VNQSSKSTFEEELDAFGAILVDSLKKDTDESTAQDATSGLAEVLARLQKRKELKP